jgi:APA family basic amino acid/polyamine antiporter
LRSIQAAAWSRIPDAPLAPIAGTVELTTLADLVSIGTLFAFVLVSIGVVILRRTRPDLPRGFRTPAAPLVAALAVVSCVYLMLNLIGETWVRFLVWMAIGLVVYFGYSRRHSRLAQRAHEPAAERVET